MLRDNISLDVTSPADKGFADDEINQTHGEQQGNPSKKSNNIAKF